MRRAAVLVVIGLFVSPAFAGKLYRCSDGSYQDKPCGDGSGAVVGVNRPAPRADADRACVETGKRAESLAKSKATGVPLEDVLAQIDNRDEPYERRIEQKKFAVQVYQAKGSPTEARILFEAECVAARGKDVPVASPAAPAPLAAPRESSPREGAEVQAQRKAQEESARKAKCAEYQSALAEIRQAQRDPVSMSEADRLSKKKRELEKKIWDLCS